MIPPANTPVIIGYSFETKNWLWFWVTNVLPDNTVVDSDQVSSAWFSLWTLGKLHQQTARPGITTECRGTPVLDWDRINNYMGYASDLPYRNTTNDCWIESSWQAAVCGLISKQIIQYHVFGMGDFKPELYSARSPHSWCPSLLYTTHSPGIGAYTAPSSSWFSSTHAFTHSAPSTLGSTHSQASASSALGTPFSGGKIQEPAMFTAHTGYPAALSMMPYRWPAQESLHPPPTSYPDHPYTSAMMPYTSPVQASSHHVQPPVSPQQHGAFNGERKKPKSTTRAKSRTRDRDSERNLARAIEGASNDVVHYQREPERQLALVRSSGSQAYDAASTTSSDKGSLGSMVRYSGRFALPSTSLEPPPAGSESRVIPLPNQSRAARSSSSDTLSILSGKLKNFARNL
ncbi:hypothetical protein FA15DRAFT_710185 [Coprinopsis marcescibilis]|uniref:Uncharacterized protein n=1 Tax=Coprinopsis marcescibilis TaxID=230819 RepID=A0A5C3KDZ9_COPMA|nr:hypothetical protein FA15DRAFT_710185 [Coprinopsis marcescibilis]